MIEHINKIFVFIIFLSLLTYFERADYNLPLFGFILLLWNQQNQKYRLWYLIAFSIIVDVVWIIYWAAVWNSYQNRQMGLCTFTIIVSVIMLLVKIGTLIALFVKDEDCSKALSQLPENLRYICSGPKQDYQHI